MILHYVIHNDTYTSIHIYIYICRHIYIYIYMYAYIYIYREREKLYILGRRLRAGGCAGSGAWRAPTEIQCNWLLYN